MVIVGDLKSGELSFEVEDLGLSVLTIGEEEEEKILRGQIQISNRG